MTTKVILNLGAVTATIHGEAERTWMADGAFDMDYIEPANVVAAMINASRRKLALPPKDLLIRGALAGALLGAATSLAFGATVTTGQPLVGAIIFPVGFVMIVLLGLELVTGTLILPEVPEGIATYTENCDPWPVVQLTFKGPIGVSNAPPAQVTSPGTGLTDQV